MYLTNYGMFAMHEYPVVSLQNIYCKTSLLYPSVSIIFKNKVCIYMGRNIGCLKMSLAYLKYFFNSNLPLF